jgi:Na+/H+ antiporter NhaD/arsenite permease-like protein
MTFYLMIIVFVLGYVCIALEHKIHVSKTASALLLGTVMWTLLITGDLSGMPVISAFQDYLLSNPDATFASWLSQVPLLHHLGETAEILFFLLGAMTIVELVDTHGGFRIITDKIATTRKTSLLWIIGLITFFMSAVLDNLTTSIVMIALLRKLVGNRKDRWFFGGMIILAANAGGAWSPIGDVTTIMLWIAGRISASGIIVQTLLPGIVSILVPLAVLSFSMKGTVERPDGCESAGHSASLPGWQRKLIFGVGVGALVFVPVFKTITHLPPYLGMLGGLSLLWILTEIMGQRRSPEERNLFSVTSILQRIDTPSILFFLGILMAVAALQTCGHLGMLSASLDGIPMADPGKYYLITVLIGALSSIVDNVPLVAGAMGMYDFPLDHYFWSFLAYAAGTGGSILIIGSAAGVAVMGMEKIDFFWYLKKISWLALIGYLAGCLVFILQHSL